MSRPQVVKQIWAYIKENNLQVTGSPLVEFTNREPSCAIQSLLFLEHAQASSSFLYLVHSLCPIFLSLTLSCYAPSDTQNPKDKRKIICDDKLKTLFKPPISACVVHKKTWNKAGNCKIVSFAVWVWGLQSPEQANPISGVTVK